MVDKKIKVMTISDHPLSPSGVGTQTRYMCEALMNTGKYQIVSLGGAVQHQNKSPMKFQEFGDDWIIYPVDGYGTQDIVRSVIRNHRPDILWFMTDPRFYIWLWEIENEIRPLLPMLYFHVWDNYPYPKFNKVLYDSNDFIATISKVTSDIVQTVAPSVEETYLPHSVNTSIFKKLPDDIIQALRKDNFPHATNKMLFFWNNRNARRKQSGTVIWWFKEFLDLVGHDKAMLLMHTDPKDVNGQDLYAIIAELGLTDQNQVMISKDKIEPAHLAALYNMADCTINIADAEGFGLATFESLACETPVIVTMTGGLQEQVTDLSDVKITHDMMLSRNSVRKGHFIYEHGIGIEPASKAIIGSQDVPYIYEDRVSKEDFLNAIQTFLKMPKEKRIEMGQKGRVYVEKNYNFETFCKRWDEVLTHVHEKHGSWDTRKNYKSWELITI